MTPPVLINETPFEVILADGTKETISLRPLTIRQLYRFVEHLGGDDMPALVALCTGRPAEWLDGLADESYTRLLAKCIEENFTRAAKLALSDPFTAAKLAPLFTRLQRAQALYAGSTSSAPSPAPAASGSAAATGSASST